MKKGVVITLIVAILFVVVFIAMEERESNENTQNNNLNQNLENNKTENEKSNEESNTNEDVEQNMQNSENVTTNSIQSTQPIEEEPKTQQEKAIEIVKDDWGNEQENVKFSVDGIDNNGNYIVSVRDKETTEALSFYIVNVEEKTFTIR